MGFVIIVFLIVTIIIWRKLISTNADNHATSHSDDASTMQSEEKAIPVASMLAFDELDSQFSDSVTSPEITDLDSSSGDNAVELYEELVNPATGLPMLPGGVLDVAGNPFGTNLRSSTDEPASIEPLSQGFTSSSEDTFASDSDTKFDDPFDDDFHSPFNDDNWT